MCIVNIARSTLPVTKTKLNRVASIFKYAEPVTTVGETRRTSDATNGCLPPSLVHSVLSDKISVIRQRSTVIVLLSLSTAPRHDDVSEVPWVDDLGKTPATRPRPGYVTGPVVTR
ncbi:hypothetical protein J6590_005129 [Homalodisca vitripennis]|nr:hypothetical protein J6590_005129 [Homalodisca vitripennis]